MDSNPGDSRGNLIRQYKTNKTDEVSTTKGEICLMEREEN